MKEDLEHPRPESGPEPGKSLRYQKERRSNLALRRGSHEREDLSEGADPSTPYRLSSASRSGRIPSTFPAPSSSVHLLMMFPNPSYLHPFGLLAVHRLVHQEVEPVFYHQNLLHFLLKGAACFMCHVHTYASKHPSRTLPVGNPEGLHADCLHADCLHLTSGYPRAFRIPSRAGGSTTARSSTDSMMSRG